MRQFTEDKSKSNIMVLMVMETITIFSKREFQMMNLHQEA
jgi:hypothetical protein